MKKLIVFACILLIGFSASARRSLITLTSLKLPDLNTEQRSRYDKLASLNLHKSKALYLVSTDVPPDVDQDNGITLNLPFLPCGSVTFAASTVEFKDVDNFSWSGRLINDKAETCFSGDIIIQKNKGLFIGNFTIDHHNYELYDLTDGVQLVLETNMVMDVMQECGTPDGGPMMPMDVTVGPCANVVTKVLVVYTNTTLSLTTDIVGKANLAIAQTNQIWANSQVNNTVSLAGVENVSFTHNSNAFTELDNLMNSTSIQALRDAYNAEIVILLGPSYGNYFGLSPIGGGYNDAYAIVDVSYATNGRYTFAHEMNHLFGARHDVDPTSGSAHGKAFATGGFLGLFDNWHFTLMANIPSNSDVQERITNLSNPQVDYSGTATGDWVDRNNALQVNQTINYVANFKNDPSLDFHTGMNIANPGYCQTYGTATATPECGTPPYHYQWYATIGPAGGFSWETLGTTQTISTYIPLSSYGLYSRAYKVVITDANGHIATKISNASSYCEEQQEQEPIGIYSGNSSNNNGNNPAQTGGGSINGVATKQKINIYPNPNNGEFNLELTGFVNESLDINLIDLSGKKVATLYNGITNGYQVIPLYIDKKLSKGIYFMKVKSKSTSLTQKFILK